MNHFLSLLLLLTLNYGFSQTILNKEIELMRDFKRINYWNDSLAKKDLQSTEDSLDEVGVIFKNNLLACTGTNPQTMSYNFQGLKNLGLHIAYTPDGNFKIYSWEAKSKNGTKYIEAIYQYKLNRKVFSAPKIKEKESDPGLICDNIFTIKVNILATYIAYYQGVYTDTTKVIQLKAYELHDTGFKDEIPFFKSKTSFDNEVNLTFNSQKSKIPEYDWVIYDEEKRNISIPVVNEEGVLIKRKTSYKFNGRCFEK